MIIHAGIGFFAFENKLKGSERFMLVHRDSGETYPTSFVSMQPRDVTERMTTENGWESSFDWSIYFDKSNVKVFKMILRGDSQIQGVIALEHVGDHIYVLMVESAPLNRIYKIFYPVGTVLFAFACKISVELGYMGYVPMNAKSKLIPYYLKVLGARQIGNSTKMYIPEFAARRLIAVYL